MFVFVGHKTAYAANPTTINFQGKVVNSDGTNVTNGTYSFVFRIYNTASPTPATACGSDASCLFEETQGSVTVTNGVFQVELGSSCSGGLVGSNSCTKSVSGGLNFNTNNALYLTLQFNGDTSGAHGGYMWPVIHFTSSPYAYYADNAGQLGGIAAGGFLQLQGSSPGSAQTGNFNITGTGIAASLYASNLDAASNVALGIGNSNATSVSLCNSSTCNTVTIATNADTDTIAIGDTLDSLTIHSTGLNLSSGGALTGVASIDTIVLDATHITFAAGGIITASGGLGLAANTSVTGLLAADPQSIGCVANLDVRGGSQAGRITACGNGASGLLTKNSGELIAFKDDNVNFTSYSYGNITSPESLVITAAGIDLDAASSIRIGPTYSTSVDIGSGASTFSLTSSTGLNVSTGGALTGVASVDTVVFDATQMTFAAAGTVSSTGANNLNLTTNDSSASIIAKSNANSTTAFQVQNASGSSILSADTIKGVITQSGFGGSYIGGADASGSTNSGTDNLTFNSVYVSGRYEYAVTNGDATACSQSAGSAIGCELQVYDVSNPSSPTYVGGADGSGSTNSGTGQVAFKSVYVSGHYAYVGTGINATACSQSAGSAIGCELKVFDVSNPSSPTYVGGADTSGSTNSGTSGNAFNSVSVSGRYAYVANANDGTACSQSAGSAIGCELKVFDVSNPASPTYVGGADGSGSTNSGTGVNTFNSVSVSGRYAYVGSEGVGTACSQSAGSAIGCELKVFDVSNPSSPTYVGGADTSGSTNSGVGTPPFYSVSVSGRYAYIGSAGTSNACSQTAGSAIGCELQVYDVSNPASPTYVGGADVSGSTNSGISSPGYVFFSVFVSGRYAYTAGSNNATACSQSAGSAIGCELQVYDVSGIDAVSINAGSLETGTLQVASNGKVFGDFDIQGSVSVGQNVEVNGDLSVNGKYGGAAIFQDKTNSTTAFVVQNASSNTLLAVDTTNQQITLGISGTSPVGMALPGTGTTDASTPDTAANSVTGQLDLIAKIQPNDWSPTTAYTIMSKYATTVTNYSYSWQIGTTTGRMTLGLSNSGTAATTATASVGTGYVNGTAHWVRVTWDATTNTNNAKFYTSEDGTTWTQLGSSQNISNVTVPSIFNSTANATVGASGTNNNTLVFNGTIYRAEIYAGFSDAGGTLENDFNPADAVSVASTSWTSSDAAAETWTLNGTALLVSQSNTIFTPTLNTVATQVLNKNNVNSTTAFQVQNASGSTILVIDTSNSAVSLNGTTTIAPTANNIGTIIKQTSGTATSGNVIDVQGANGTSHFIQVTQTAANAGAVNISSIGSNDLTLDSGSAILKFGSNTTSLQKAASSFTLDVNNAGTSTLNVSNSNGANVADLSVSGNIAVGTGKVYKVGATSGSTISTCGASNYVSSFATAGGIVTGGSCSTIASSNLSDSSNIALLNAANTFTNTSLFKANSTSAFQIQNSSGANIINVDTTGSLTSNNLVANPSFETTISGSGAGVWVIKQGGAGTPAIANNTSNFYNQLKSASVVTTANANDGIKQQLNSTLTASTAYNITFYAKLDPTSNAMATLQAGYSSTGASDDQVCANSATINATGWTKYICTITTGAATSSSNYFFIRQSDTVIHTFYVDAVLLQLASTADSNYRDAKIALNGVINTPLILQNADNSSNAFQVQNATGGQVFSVDTTDGNLINNPANPSFENNTAGWTTVVPSGTVTIARDTSQQSFGIASLKVVTSGASAQGVRYTLASGSWPTNLTASYTVSFSVLNGNGTAFSAIPIVKFGNGSDNACNAATLMNGATGTVPVQTAWTRYQATCTFSGTVTSIAIEQNEATAHTFYVDSVQLETGTTASNYGLGQITLNGQIITPVTLKASSNSSQAFQIQNSSGNLLLSVDSLNSQVILGSSSNVNGTLVFNNSTNTNTVTLVSGLTSAAYSLSLPTAAPATNQCLAASSTTQLAFNNCNNFLSAYNTAGTCNGSNITLQFTGTANSAPSCSSATLTLPSNTTKLMLEMKGGGGAGGGDSNANAIKDGSGGGEGAFLKAFVASVSSSCNGGTGAQCFYTVGGTASGNTSSVNGNASCFGTNGTACTSPIYSAGGGTGGTQGTSSAFRAGGAGGTCSGSGTAALCIPGTPGGWALGASPALGGAGGGTGGGAAINASGNGNAAVSASGGGGSGGLLTAAAATTENGGNGGSGFMTIYVYTGSTGADLAEWYDTQSNVSAGDVVAISGKYLSYTNSKDKPQKIAVLQKATQSGKALLGVVSTAPNNVMDDGLQAVANHPEPIALNGRVPVKVNLDNGPIHAGDLLTISSKPGFAMRLTSADNPVIGQALADYDGNGNGTVLTFVKTQYLTGKSTVNWFWPAIALTSIILSAGAFFVTNKPKFSRHKPAAKP